MRETFRPVFPKLTYSIFGLGTAPSCSAREFVLCAPRLFMLGFGAFRLGQDRLRRRHNTDPFARQFAHFFFHVEHFLFARHRLPRSFELSITAAKSTSSPIVRSHTDCRGFPRLCVF